MSEAPVTLRPARDEELDAIADLVNASYRGAGGWTNELGYIQGPRTLTEHLRRDLAKNPGAMLLAADDNPATVGGALAGVVRLDRAGGDVWELSMLTVRPDLQDRGFGRGMLDAAEAVVARNGGTHIDITVLNIRASLIAWYGRRGYRATGETRPFPYEHSPFGRPLRDDLAFAVFKKAILEGAD